MEESNLSQNICILKRALGDFAQERRYILTDPGKGYQFTETREIGEQQEEKQAQEEKRRSRSKKPLLLFAYDNRRARQRREQEQRASAINADYAT
jgi:DNA-binding winged helix-turn-helix (wHTH) protein